MAMLASDDFGLRDGRVLVSVDFDVPCRVLS